MRRLGYWSPQRRLRLAAIASVCFVGVATLVTAAGPAGAGAFPGTNGKIAFVSARAPAGIYTMNADGSDQTLLASVPARRLDWSPDGTKIAFEGAGASGSTLDFDIYVMNATARESQT